MVKLTSLLLWNGAHNIPKKFIQRAMFKGVVYENNNGMTPTVVYNYTKDYIFSEKAPWTTEAQKLNDPSVGKKRIVPLVPPLKDWYWFRGDLVEILTGKDKGKQGSISAVIKQRNWVIVTGLNTKMDVIRQGNSSIVRQTEEPLIVNKDIKLIDPFDKKPCDAIWRYLEDGTKVRVSKRTGRVIPIQDEEYSTVDYAKKELYKPDKKDTQPGDVKNRTYKPKLKTFEDELMEEYGIEETRTRAETFVY